MLHHAALGLDEQAALAVERAVVNAGDADEQGLGVDGAQLVFGHGPEEHAVARVEQAAYKYKLDVLVVDEQVGDGQRVGDELEGLAEQLLGEVERRRAAVDQYG